MSRLLLDALTVPTAKTRSSQRPDRPEWSPPREGEAGHPARIPVMSQGAHADRSRIRRHLLASAASSSHDQMKCLHACLMAGLLVLGLTGCLPMTRPDSMGKAREPMPLTIQVEVQSAGTARPLASKEQLHASDRFAIYLRSSKPGRIYLLHAPQSGSVQILRSADIAASEEGPLLRLPAQDAWLDVPQFVSGDRVCVVLMTTPGQEPTECQHDDGDPFPRGDRPPPPPDPKDNKSRRNPNQRTIRLPF